MNEKLDTLMKKIRASATVAGEYASKTASDIGKKTSSAFNVSKLNLQIFDLNTDLDVIYKEIGKIICASHRGAEADSELLEEKLREADEKIARIDELKGQIEAQASSKKCAVCESECDADAAFCAKCGNKF